MTRFATLLYGAVSYVIGFGSLAYAIFFLNNFLVPRTIDAGEAGSFQSALLINLSLATLFALQHSIMPRRWFKRAITRVIPAAAERSTYVLFSGLALIALYAFWQPMPETIWSADSPTVQVLAYGLQALGWMWLIASTFMLDHLELFGMKQVVANMRRRPLPAMRFRTPGFYNIVRHPIQLGVLIAFWATPDMSLGRLVLCIAITGYILVALTQLEERDLVREFGSEYTDYRKRVGMLLPKFGGRVQEQESLQVGK